MSYTVLVIGSGGREHAIAWKLAQSPQVTRLVVAPGNAGMSKNWELWPFSLSSSLGHPSIESRRRAFQELGKKALQEKVDLVIVGPDQPLADGIVDIFLNLGLSVVGPTAQAAQIEASKSFAKQIMFQADVPTARYWIASTPREAEQILSSLCWTQTSWVLKADGLAYGKGVRICSSLTEASVAASDLFKISNQLVIEEYLEGEEVSWMAFCDGEDCALLEPARDYKRLLYQNRGPNTGGMGSISPIPEISVNQSLLKQSEWGERIQNQVFLPILKEMKKRGTPFSGILYAGLMINFEKNQFWVLEFNSRFGDPETQVLLPRIQGDLLPWMEAIAQGKLKNLQSKLGPWVPFQDQYAVCVIAATAGYPHSPELGRNVEIQFINPNRVEVEITNVLEKNSESEPTYFYAGVKKENDKWITTGGRVLGCVGMGPSLSLAREKAYQLLKDIKFEGMHYRTDIGLERTVVK